MTVLMFGWEFPPHISGGLGTACAGLTHALEQEHVDVLFVVPVLRGGESAGSTTFVNASTIPIQVHADEPMPSGRKPTPGNPHSPTGTATRGKSRVRSKSKITRIEVSATLSPYGVVSADPEYDLEKWNYSLDETIARSKPAGRQTLQPTRGVRTEGAPEKAAFRFSGTYGPRLMEEVRRYAQVGAEVARTAAFDVIHAHDWMTYLAGIEAKKISGKPLIVHVHATEIDRSGTQVQPEVFAIEQQGMAGADRVVTVSQWTKDIAVKHYGVDASKVVVVHNGILPKRPRPMLAGPVFPGGPVITFLGRITHQKGPLYFVEAARRVHERFPDAQFVVAGSGDQLPLMIERIAQVRLSRYFHFTGFLKGDDIERIWSMSSVYVMPSVSEPFGIAPLEAIQAGVPVIISKQAGVSEVMPHAIKVDFWNSEELAEAICQLISYKSLANTLKKNGAEAVRFLTWKKAAKKITTLYDELSKNHLGKEESCTVLSGAPAKPAQEAALL